ncbi:hypothetical protein CCDG5_1283 [[Clostridium] cellulosi]|jgi:Recombinase./Resolvase, N terminal domain.|uniref:Recombinase family protein n=1 Tax=[Clostridium] cellulosi TaxID=29343 RepID=A0A078KPG3_9FIRM|nr:MAG: recombinase family protein [[Clostridium] cellulosi]CDZ24397.1 hypothetical protein CCDG5_1283 [[Clostridium] cellulosi]
MTAAIYARQSIEKPDSVSIEAQIERCKKVCELNGWDYIVYSDTGFSGKNIDRPNFKKLLNDIRSGKIKALISYKLDRISRSIADFASLLQLFEKYGVQYISCTEQFDTSSPVGRAMIYIVMVFAQLERETITQRVTDNYRFRASKGLFMGGSAPLGYIPKQIEIEGHRASVLEIDGSCAQIVKKIFTLYQSGLNTHSIAKRLNEEGIRTSKNKLYTPNAVLRILRNITYCSSSPELYDYLKAKGYEILCSPERFDGKNGMCCYFKSSGGKKSETLKNQLITVGRHKPIIPAKQWIEVQRKIDRAGVSPAKAKPSARAFLAGLMKCSCCGRSIGLKCTKKKSGEYAYYYCRTRLTMGAGKCSNDLWINKNVIEPRIETFLLIHAKELFKNNNSIEIAQPAENTRISKLKAEYFSCKDSIRNLIGKLGENNVVDRHINDYILELDAKCRRIEAEIQRIQKSEKRAKSGETSGKAYNIPQIFSKASVEDRRLAARSLIKQITISRSGDIQIEWRV